jgi:pentapeptide MXKDX repeat protein
MPYRKRKRHELDLLCRAGVGIAPLCLQSAARCANSWAPRPFRYFGWTNREMPAGLFHENAADSALDLFVNEYDRLFTGPSEIDVSQIAAMKGGPVGQLMNPGPDYFRSNVAFAQDSMSKVGGAKDAMTRDSMKKDESMSKDVMKKSDTMKKDAMTKDFTKK